MRKFQLSNKIFESDNITKQNKNGKVVKLKSEF